MEVFPDLGKREVVEMIGQRGQEGVADEGQIGQEVWVATAGAVLSHECVTSPVVAIFHPAPVPTDQPHPLLRAWIARRDARKMIPRLLGGAARFLVRPLAADHHQAPCMGEAGLHGLDGEGMEFSDLDPPVPALAQ